MNKNDLAENVKHASGVTCFYLLLVGNGFFYWRWLKFGVKTVRLEVWCWEGV